MRHTVRLPRVGETVDEVVIIEWRCAVGDTVEAGGPLIDVETDKVTTVVPSPVAGTLVEQLVSPDEEVSTGAPIAVIESS